MPTYLDFGTYVAHAIGFVVIANDAALVAPGGKAARGVEVRLARVVVVDLGVEEFQNAQGGLGRRREQRGGLRRRRGGEDDFRSGHTKAETQENGLLQSTMCAFNAHKLTSPSESCTL